MKLAEYTQFDGTGLGTLVARGEVSPRELARAAALAIECVNPVLNAVVETYADRIEGLDESTLAAGPFRGVPFLIKDVFGHEAGRRIEFGSRLCKGMLATQDTAYLQLVRAAGLNVLGRSAAPELSMAGSTEGALYGNTCTPWREGFSAGGSSGGAMAAVMAGIVPIAHGSDIGGSIRIPASYCGGVGLKPSRGRVSFGPMLDENGFGLAQNFVQTRSIRDAAAMLDALAVPQPGDPFIIPRPSLTYAQLTATPPPRLRIGWSVAPLMGIPVHTAVQEAVRSTASMLHDMGHEVEEFDIALDGLAMLRSMMDVWYFGLDLRLQSYARRSGYAIGPQTLQPVTYRLYEYARRMRPQHLLDALAALNSARRTLASCFAAHDVWMTPTTPTTAAPWGRFHLGREDLDVEDLPLHLYAPVCQFVLPQNVMGTPAISLPLGMSDGLPIGVQFSAPPAREDLLLQLASALESARLWSDRRPKLHAADPAVC